MNRPIWKMYWPNGCKMTVERMRKENEAKKMDMETTKRINSNLENLTKVQEQAGIYREATKLKDWQWETMLENESKGEDWD